MKVVLLDAMAVDVCEGLEAVLAEPYEVFRCDPALAPDHLVHAAQHADAVVTSAYHRGLPPMPGLRLLQVPLAGFDKVDLAALSPAVTVCNVNEHEPAVAEYAVLAMLAWSHRYLEAAASFRSGSWHYSSRTGGPRHSELMGSTVGILGLGRIGLAIAARLSPFGVRVIACNRSPRPLPAGIASLYPLAELPAFLAAADFVIVCCALTPETVGIVDAAALAAMRRSAVLINIARGDCVDEAALFEACRSGRIAGAVVDTWYRYPTVEEPSPRPSRFPFHELPNVVMTPHSSAWTHGLVDRRRRAIADNLDRLAAGRSLQNVVRPGAVL